MSKVVATVTKESRESKVGLALYRSDELSPLVVSVVREGGLFAATDLVPGMLVLQINGVDVTKGTSKDAAEMLKKAEGEVTVVAKATVATAKKDNPDTLCGVSLQRQEGNGIVITKIRQGGLFDGTALAPGLRVSAINGKKCPGTTKEAIGMLKESIGEVTIVAFDPKWATVDDDDDEPEPVPSDVKEDPVAAGEPAQEQAPETPKKAESVEVEEKPTEESDSQEAAQDRSAEKPEEDSSILDRLCTICT